MAVLLYIDSALQKCSVALAENEKVLSFGESLSTNTASEELNGLISRCLEDSSYTLKDINGVCVSKGPGSYTGLRISMALAKGICFALDIPLFGISTLEMMVFGAASRYGQKGYDLYVPMIDARRMEVFTAVYTISNDEIDCCNPPHALVLNENSFDQYRNGKILFFGSGAIKAESIYPFKRAEFWLDFQPQAIDMIKKGHRLYLENKAENVAYIEPQYLKDYHFR